MTQFIPALLVKLTLILALGLASAATLRSLSPSLRHLILFATLAIGLTLPIATLISPQWNLAVLPRSSSAAVRGSGLSADPREPNLLGDSRVLSDVTNSPHSSSALTANMIGAGAVQSPSDSRSILAALPLLWAAGFIAVIGWLAIGRFRLYRIARTSWPLDTPDWSNILDRERRDAGVTKLVLLFSSSVVSTPLTWGSRAPVILVPEDALDWPEAHRRIVLRHELAHVARNDSFAQLVAGFVCALYWFHPLVWMTERRLRAECERACDDTVVSLGTAPAEYAAHLLEVARSARAFGAPGFLSVAMARPSQLEGRLLAVLNESRRRVSLSRGARPAAALLSALVLLPLAAFRAVPRGEQSVEPSARRLSSEPAASPTATARSARSTKATAAKSSPDHAARPNSRNSAADTTFQLSAPAQSAGTLTLDLRTGGKIIITGWDKPQVLVRASLGGRNWRETEVKLEALSGGARLEARYTGHSSTQSFDHLFEISVPRNFNVRLSSAGGALSIAGVNGDFSGRTGGGEINITGSSGEADLRTGGGDIRVSDSRLIGNVRTGGGVVRIERVTGNLSGSSGSGPVIYTATPGGATIRRENGVNIIGVGTNDNATGSGVATSSGPATLTTTGTTTFTMSGTTSGVTSGIAAGSGGLTTTSTHTSAGVGSATSFGASGVRMNAAGGAISLVSAPDGARVTTGGGSIRIGPSGGEVYASTGGGPIDVGPATGSVEAHTGAGDVTIELSGAGAHSVDVTSGKGKVLLVLPRDLNATLELETAYTNNLGHKTRIVSDFPVQTTETSTWDDSGGTPRRYVRARQTIGRGGGVIRVRTVNGDIVLQSRRK